MLLNIRYGTIVTTLLLLTMSCSHRSVPTQLPTVETGVSETLARMRKQTLDDLAYALKFDIPAQKNQQISATETITFTWHKNKDALQLDFKEERGHIKWAWV